MDEGEIRQLAGMYAIVAEMEAVKANIEAMKADNLGIPSGYVLAWPGSSFKDASNELQIIAERLRREI